MHVLDKFRYCPVCGSKHFVEQSEKSKHCESCGFEYFLNPSSAVAAFILNEQGELLVTRRKFEPGRGTLDLPGGFCDIGETIGEALIREVREETSLTVKEKHYFCSLPNKYRYSEFDVPTLDAFFVCKVEDETVLKAAETFKPNLIADYLYELSKKLNSFYNNCPILNQDIETLKSRALLIKKTGEVLKEGLELLGIPVLNKM